MRLQCIFILALSGAVDKRTHNILHFVFQPYGSIASDSSSSGSSSRSGSGSGSSMGQSNSTAIVKTALLHVLLADWYEPLSRLFLGHEAAFEFRIRQLKEQGKDHEVAFMFEMRQIKEEFDALTAPSCS